MVAVAPVATLPEAEAVHQGEPVADQLVGQDLVDMPVHQEPLTQEEMEPVPIPIHMGAMAAAVALAAEAGVVVVATVAVEAEEATVAVAVVVAAMQEMQMVQVVAAMVATAVAQVQLAGPAAIVVPVGLLRLQGGLQEGAAMVAA